VLTRKIEKSKAKGNRFRAACWLPDVKVVQLRSSHPDFSFTSSATNRAFLYRE
jgi:hypothetical protein